MTARPPQENTEIPQEVIDAVKAEFKKTRITTRADIQPRKVREYLKKLKLNKYYEHCNSICNLLNGVPPPRLSTALEERLKAMFAEIQEPFEKHCPANRKNFLSYGYVCRGKIRIVVWVEHNQNVDPDYVCRVRACRYTLYKFCELLGEDALCKYFPLLKSNEKLYAQDQIWKKICKELQWEFIPSV